VALVRRDADGAEHDRADGLALAALLLGTGPSERSTLFDAEQIAQRLGGLVEIVRAVATVNEENASRSYSAALYVVADDLDALVPRIGAFERCRPVAPADSYTVEVAPEATR
jgi:hypothetical protein